MKILLQGANFANTVTPQIYFSHIMSRRYGGHEVYTCGLHERDDIRFEPGGSLEQVLAGLPRGWRPDLYLVQGPEYQVLPEGLEDAPFPVVGSTYDYDYCVAAMRAKASLFDWIITYSEIARDELIGLGAKRVSVFAPWVGFLPQMVASRPRPLRERPVDIFFAGVIDDALHPDRSRLIFRLASLADRYKVHVQSYMPIDAYRNALNDSKLVFTFHRRGEIQSRTIEAMASGAVGVAQGSRELLELLRPHRDGKGELLPYDAETLEAVVEGCLSDPVTAEALASRGRKRVYRDCDSHKRLKAFLQHIERGLGEIDVARRTRGNGDAARGLALAGEAHYAVFPFSDFPGIDRQRILDVANEKLEQSLALRESAEALNGLGVVCLTRALAGSDYEVSLADLNRAFGWFKQCASRYPNYALAYYNMGTALRHGDQPRGALAAYQMASHLAREAPTHVDPLGTYECGEDSSPSSFRRVWNDALMRWSLAGETTDREAFQRVLRANAGYHAARLLDAEGERSKAIEAIEEAVQADGTRGFLHRTLGSLLIRAGRREAGRRALEKALDLDPLSCRVAADLVYALSDEGRVQEGRDLARKYATISRAVEPARKYQTFFETASRDPAIVRQPRVSVVIPVYNYEKYIRRSIESALNQTYPNIEIIVVDHGSTDRSGAIALSYGERIRYFFVEREGSRHDTSTPLLYGIRQASGEYIAWLNADDYFLPEKIELQIAETACHPGAALFYSDYICEIEPGVDVDTLRRLSLPLTPAHQRLLAAGRRVQGRAKVPGPEEADFIYKLLQSNFIIASTTLIRKAALEEVGGFRSTLFQAQDHELWLRLALRGLGIVHMPEPLAVFRIHAVNTAKWDSIKDETREIVREVENEYGLHGVFPSFEKLVGPGRVGAYEKMGALLAQHGLFGEAKGYLDKVLLLKPDSMSLRALREACETAAKKEAEVVVSVRGTG
jgi:glycosyltransferase involved in cell wall biosynthesis